MSCSCTGMGNAGRMLNGKSGMGQIDPVSAALAIADAKQTWDNLVKALGIGAGAREADIITPVQNKVFNGTVAPIVDYLTNINNGSVQPDCTALRNDLAGLTSAQTQWLNYLHTTKWQDGRAAAQAEATLQPWFVNTLADLQKHIDASCAGIGSILPTSVSQIFTTPTGGVNWPVVAGLGIGAYLLMKRK
jgi:hypothetical protein